MMQGFCPFSFLQFIFPQTAFKTLLCMRHIFNPNAHQYLTYDSVTTDNVLLVVSSLNLCIRTILVFGTTKCMKY